MLLAAAGLPAGEPETAPLAGDASATFSVPSPPREAAARVSPGPAESRKAAAQFTVVPKYPPKALGTGLEGRVQVCFTVDTNGKAVDPVIVESAHELFEQPTLDALRRSVFRPATEAGAPVPGTLCRTYSYRYRD